MASDVSEDLGLETELADGFAVCSGLLGGSWRCKFYVFYTESIQCFGDCDFGFGVEEGIGKLFTL